MVCIPPGKIKINLSEENEEDGATNSKDIKSTGTGQINTCGDEAVVASSDPTSGHSNGSCTEGLTNDSSNKDFSANADDVRYGNSTLLPHGADKQSSPDKQLAPPEKKAVFSACDEISASIGKIQLAAANVT